MIYSASMVGGPPNMGMKAIISFNKQKINLLLALLVFVFFAIFPIKC